MSEPTDTATPVDVAEAISRVAIRVARHYHGYVTSADVAQQLHLHCLTSRSILREADNGEVQRVYRELHGEAARYCEQQKAARVGYHPDDNTRYSVETVTRLLPLASDPLFDGTAPFDDDNDGGGSKKPGGDGKNLLVQVIDVRVAARRVGWDAERIADHLSGVGPPRRRAMSNAASQAVTRNQEDGG